MQFERANGAQLHALFKLANHNNKNEARKVSDDNHDSIDNNRLLTQTTNSSSPNDMSFDTIYLLTQPWIVME